MTLTRLLVANRGEIALRVIRAAHELGLGAVAIHAWEDRAAAHVRAADEARVVGRRGEPVAAYLDVEEILRVAHATGCDAVHPGYGFLAENASFAAACARAGVVFVGPSPEVLAATGDKVRARGLAEQAGVPVLRASAPSTDVESAVSAADAVGFPLFVKATAGGGGRGVRRVESPAALPDAVALAMREAASAFGDPTIFLEEAVADPRHVEVQVLADAAGDVVHLFDRDCSLQRRHQKLVELAPAPGLPAALRERLCDDATRFARAIGYRGAGTVEFLLGRDGRHVFIEMNPRVQVEHTVTEEVTGVDVVRTQLRLAAGETLASLGLRQSSITLRGAAVQCRITTEDPSRGFVPQTGRIDAYRAPAGPGVRVDEGTVHVGAVVTGHFDSLLLKVTCRGADHEHALVRARRALSELRVAGVPTNVGLLRRVLEEPAVARGEVTTGFLEQRPDLLAHTDPVDPDLGVVRWVAETTVRRPWGAAPSRPRPEERLPALPPADPSPGSRDELRRLGPAAFAQALRARTALAVTDTTFRDAHQSLLATRVRTRDLLAVAPHVAHLLPGLLSVEAWGGATFDVALRYLHESPWERLARLRDAMPNLCLQMLLRGRNTVAYGPASDDLCAAFVAEAVRTGVDVFRVFDAMNDVDNMRPAVRAVLEEGAVCEGTICYTGDLLDAGEGVYTLDYYLALAERLVAEGVHVLAIKDMAGLLRAPAAGVLVRALRERFDRPVHLHTHDTAGGQLATLLAAAAAGVDAVDAAMAPLAGTTSQPSLAALVAATDGTERATGLRLDALNSLESYWEAVRGLYAPFDSGLSAPTGRVYEHEIPGGQLSNLRQQAEALGLGDRFDEVMRLYAHCDRLLGRLIKVTPTSKVVGDLALALAAAGVDATDFAQDPDLVDLPDSVVRFLQGELGTPPAGWPEPFRSHALRRHTPAPGGVADVALLPADLPPGPRRQAVLDEVLFPTEARSFAQIRARYGDLSGLPTDVFFYGVEPGQDARVDVGARSLTVGVVAVGPSGPAGLRTVVCHVDGEPVLVDVPETGGADDGGAARKADRDDPGQVGAPFAGEVRLKVAVGDRVRVGDVLAVIEAMKMESAVSAPAAGVVDHVAVDGPVAAVEAGDLLLVLRATQPDSPA